MKRFNFLLLALFLIVFFSCSKDDDNRTPEVNDRQVKFLSGINSATLRVRVGGTEGDQWEGNETIGIYMVKHKHTAIIENAENILYTNTSTGTRATFTSATPICYPVSATQKVDFIAYYPHNTSVNRNVYQLNVANQSNQSDLDLMTAKANNTGSGYNKTNTSPVNLNFTHQLSKLVLNVKGGNGVTIPTKDDLIVNIEGMKIMAKFNLFTEILTTSSDKADIVPQSVTNNTGYYTYEATLLPVKHLNASHIIKFKVGDNSYTWKIKDNSSSINSFDAGNKYIFDLALHNKEVEVIGTITPWNTTTANGVAITD